MYVYIDESGDEGTSGKGSRWLVFGCVVLPSETYIQAEQVVSSALNARRQSKLSYIRFSDLNHASKKGILSIFEGCGWYGIVVASDTTKILPESKLSEPSFQYNYPLRYAIERISKCAKQLEEPVDKIIIEKRRGFKLGAFQQYLNKLKSEDAPDIKWKFIDINKIELRDKLQEPKLCLADGLAHSIFKALEPDDWWGHYELAYLDLIKDRLWRNPSKVQQILNFGLTLMPTKELSGFIKEYPWLKTLT